jgi:hypothetical protein
LFPSDVAPLFEVLRRRCLGSFELLVVGLARPGNKPGCAGPPPTPSPTHSGTTHPGRLLPQVEVLVDTVVSVAGGQCGTAPVAQGSCGSVRGGGTAHRLRLLRQRCVGGHTGLAFLDQSDAECFEELILAEPAADGVSMQPGDVPPRRRFELRPDPLPPPAEAERAARSRERHFRELSMTGRQMSTGGGGGSPQGSRRVLHQPMLRKVAKRAGVAQFSAVVTLSVDGRVPR